MRNHGKTAVAAPGDNNDNEDDRLMARAAAGDTGAFGCIVRRHQARLLGFARRFLPHEPAVAADDVVQEAFVRLWHERERYEPHGRLVFFLFQIVRNLCRDRARASASSFPSALSDEPADTDIFDDLRARALAEAVQQAVAELHEEQRAVFVLSHYEGLRYHEIADVLDCPLGTVASRKHQAVRTLRRRLAGWLDNEPGQETNEIVKDNLP
jgi:RNA polymerase sigma-70 factor (ECF subfamily)